MQHQGMLPAARFRLLACAFAALAAACLAPAAAQATTGNSSPSFLVAQCDTPNDPTNSNFDASHVSDWTFSEPVAYNAGTGAGNRTMQAGAACPSGGAINSMASGVGTNDGAGIYQSTCPYDDSRDFTGGANGFVSAALVGWTGRATDNCVRYRTQAGMGAHTQRIYEDWCAFIAGCPAPGNAAGAIRYRPSGSWYSESTPGSGTNFTFTAPANTRIQTSFLSMRGGIWNKASEGSTYNCALCKTRDGTGPGHAQPLDDNTVDHIYLTVAQDRDGSNHFIDGCAFYAAGTNFCNTNPGGYPAQFLPQPVNPKTLWNTPISSFNAFNPVGGGASATPSAGTASRDPVAISVGLACQPTEAVYNKCTAMEQRQPPVGACIAQCYNQANIRISRSLVEINDFEAPTAGWWGGSAPSAPAGTWFRGTHTAAWLGGDNTGVWFSNLSVDGGGAIDGRTQTCNGPAAYGGANQTFFSKTPCPTFAGNTHTIDTTAVADGVHTLKLQDWDPALNSCDGSQYAGWSAYATPAAACPTMAFRVDNSVPPCANTAYGSCGTVIAPSGGCGLTVTAPAADAAPDWIKGTKTVSATACDPGSGISSAVVQYQSRASSMGAWGAWTSLSEPGCQDAAAVGGGVIKSLSCTFSSASGGYGLAEGSQVRFRVWAQNNTLAGSPDAPSANTSAESDIRTVDNTPPTVSAVAFTRPGALPLGSPGSWLNNPAAAASWTLSIGAGSPVASVKYIHTPGSCGAEATVTLAGAATSASIPNSPVACQQGTHTLDVWAADTAGNVTQAAPYMATGTYKYDSVDPAAPAGLTITPPTWTPVNSFTAAWTNDTFNSTTSSPLEHVYARLGSAGRVTWDASTTPASCLGSGAACSKAGIAVPGAGGAYPLRIWNEDRAGNASEESSAATGVLYFDDSLCPR